MSESVSHHKRRRPKGTPGRTSDPLAVSVVPRLPRKSRQKPPKEAETQRDARAYIRPLGSAHCPTPATQKPPKAAKKGGDPKGRQGVHPTPWQYTLSHACHAKAAKSRQKRRRPKGTPGRTSDPLAVHIVPRLPRKSRQRGGDPTGRQGVHPTPWQCTLSHACHAKAAKSRQKRRRPKGTPGRTSDPLAVHIVPRLPRKSRQRGGDPKGRQGVHPTPWQCTLSHACHAKAAKEAETQRDARAYIRPLGSAHCPTPATQKPPKAAKRSGDPKGRQGVHPTPWQCTLSHACHAKAAKEAETQRDARAYIRPLGSAHCPTPATQKPQKRRRPKGTPGRRPLGSAHCHTPATQKPPKAAKRSGDPKGRQGVHPTPWQCTLSHACHAKAAKEAETQRDARAYIRPLGSAHCLTPATQKPPKRRRPKGTPGRTSDPLAMHFVPRLPRKSRQKPPKEAETQRDARAYIRPLGSAHCPTPATQKPPKAAKRSGDPKGRQGVHPTPWQCTLSHACHAKAAKSRQKKRRPKGTPGRTSDPLAVHIVPRLPRKSRQRGGDPKGRQGVHPTPWQCTLSHARHAKAAKSRQKPRKSRQKPPKESESESE